MEDISAAQVRAARGLIGWSQNDLAEAAEVEAASVAHFEAGHPAPDARMAGAFRAALEAAGVEFIAENGGGAGVRLKRPSPPSIPSEDLNASNDE